jgi:hypothetical protein
VNVALVNGNQSEKGLAAIEAINEAEMTLL